MSAGRLVGVGVGPGDPELVTLRAVRVLASADVVFVPVAGTGEAGRAEAVVLANVRPATLRRLPFPLERDEAAREQAWAEAAAAVAEAVTGGAVAAFATIGDPSVYSTFAYLAERVAGLVPGVAVEVVPGITAMQELAARSRVPLVAGTERLILLPLVDGTDGLDEALASHDTVVCYKGGARLPDVLDAVDRAGRLGAAVYGARLGLPGERLCPAAEVRGERGPYLSTLIVHRDGSPGDRRRPGR